MLQEELHHRYFEWLYGMVCGEEQYNRLTYRKLLYCLYNIEFTYLIDLDENRAQDGIEFRYDFGYYRGYSDSIISKYLDIRPCNMFEMMVALAHKGEEMIMDDSNYGDRTGQWFWNMIVSLGLGKMNDLNFDEDYVYRTVYRFLDRNYEPDGEGGLFTIRDCQDDLRDVEIWTQYMWYLNTVIEDF